MSEPLVILGNGMAAARLVDELTRSALGRYAIAVVGEEPRLAYNRVLLSSVLAGEIEAKDIELRTAEWWRHHGVTLRYGCAAVSVDAARRIVTLADGKDIPFAKLVFATGSQPLKPPIPGIDLPGVHTFRDRRDVEHLAELGRTRQRVVVIGGGLLGLEAAYGLVLAGADVTLLHLMDRLMERQLDAPAGALLKRLVESRGIKIVLNANTDEIVGSAEVEAVTLKDGTRIEADAVVIAAGIRPNAGLAQAAGIDVKRGIVVDDGMQTSSNGIFALGECAEHRGICYGLVEPAYEQAKVLATRLAGGEASYEGSITATNLKVTGVNVFSAGDFLGEGHDCITLSDPGLGTYRKLVIARNRLIGAVLVGDVTEAHWYLELIRTGKSIQSVRDGLMFGPPRAELQEAA